MTKTAFNPAFYASSIYFGAVGALLFFVGDMLMYGHFGAASDFRSGMLAVVRESPLWRLHLGGLLGLLAAWFCVLGFSVIGNHIVHYTTRRWMMALALFSMIGLGAVHVLWIARALVLRTCVDASATCQMILSSINDYWNWAYYIAVAPGYVAGFVLALAVWRGQTPFPRWSIFFNPVLLMLLTPLSAYGPAPWGAIWAGGDANIYLGIFFLVHAFACKPKTVVKID
ncbi:MAG: hypothetical protein K2Y28_13310 [Burkholderiaceae bacterium]|nr:hypothetical protein [Burkholderiaceae bacterium]